MKILLLANGESIHTVRWIAGLSEAGIDVVLVTQHRGTSNIPPSIKVHQLPFSGPAGYFLNARALKSIWDREMPDLMNAHYASGYGTTARLAGCHPLLLSVWGSDVYEVPQRSQLHRWWIRGNLEAADKIASTSKVMAEQTRRVAPNARKIEVTPFGIDLNLFAPLCRSPAADPGIITIGTVKKLSPIYGVDILIESFVCLREMLRDDFEHLSEMLRLRIVGDGQQTPELKALASQRGILDVTKFVAGVSHAQVPEELAKLDVYVALSREESFGVAVLEAGACGLPAVVSDVGGLPEIVVHQETGIVVPRENPIAAAEAIKSLVVDPRRRQTIGAAARAHVERQYAWRESVKQMIEVYETTIAAHRCSAT